MSDDEIAVRGRYSDEINKLRAEVERLKEDLEDEEKRAARCEQARAQLDAEVERLRASVHEKMRESDRLRADWDTLRADNERLVALVREAVPFMRDAGNDEDPEAQAVACAWLENAK